MKNCLIGKDSDAGRDCGQEEKGTTEDRMAGWHHRLDEHGKVADTYLAISIILIFMHTYLYNI